MKVISGLSTRIPGLSALLLALLSFSIPIIRLKTGKR